MFTTIRQSVSPALKRAYSTAAPKQGGTNWTVIGGIAVAGAAGYYYYTQAGKPDVKAAVEKAVRPAAINKDNFVDLTLSQVKQYNHNSKIYHLAFPDKEAVAGSSVSSLVMVKSPEAGKIVDDKGADIARPYTPISSPDTVGELVLLVKKYDTGKLTPWLDSLKVGDKVSIKGPMNKFVYKANTWKQGVMIAGGSGITPMYQVIHHSLSLPSDSTKWTLFYSNVTEADILLREELDSLAKAHPDRFKLIYALDKPEKTWKGLKGFISADLIKKEALPASEGQDVRVFVCGPPGQVAAVAGPKDGYKQGEVGGALAALGYTKEQVFKY